jgi:hypothetical protein
VQPLLLHPVAEQNCPFSYLQEPEIGPVISTVPGYTAVVVGVFAMIESQVTPPFAPTPKLIGA